MKQYIIVNENHKDLDHNTINCAENLSNDIESNDVVIMDKSILMKLYDNLKSVDTSRIIRDFRSKLHSQHMSMEEYTKIITDEYEWLSFKEKIKEFKIAEQECTDTTVEEPTSSVNPYAITPKVPAL